MVISCWSHSAWVACSNLSDLAALGLVGTGKPQRQSSETMDNVALVTSKPGRACFVNKDHVLDGFRLERSMADIAAKNLCQHCTVGSMIHGRHCS